MWYLPPAYLFEKEKEIPSLYLELYSAKKKNKIKFCYFANSDRIKTCGGGNFFFHLPFSKKKIEINFNFNFV
jgi:hypothetical protein